MGHHHPHHSFWGCYLALPPYHRYSQPSSTSTYHSPWPCHLRPVTSARSSPLHPFWTTLRWRSPMMVSSCAPPPGLFLGKRRQNHSHSSFRPENLSSSDPSSCPICQQYLQGPCGSLFQAWLDCNESTAAASSSSSPHPPRHNDSEPARPTVRHRDDDECLECLEAWRTCKEQHDQSHHDDDGASLPSSQHHDLYEAWEQVLQEEELLRAPHVDFPTDQRPILQKMETASSFFSRPTTQPLTLSVVAQDLVLVWIRDATSVMHSLEKNPTTGTQASGGRLLAAASKGEMDPVVADSLLQTQEWVSMALDAPAHCTTLTLSALYEKGRGMEGNDALVVYQNTWILRNDDDAQSALGR